MKYELSLAANNTGRLVASRRPGANTQMRSIIGKLRKLGICIAMSLVAPVSYRDQWENNGALWARGANGNAIKREATARTAHG